MPRRVYSIGHSNRTLGEFIGILRTYGIEVLVDVRRYPRSRKHPWFNREVLEEILPRYNIEYVWLGEELGGLGRDYKKHMCTPEYARGIERLVEIAKSRLTAFMCAEAYWLNCHRRYIAESLTHRGFQVIHIIDANRVEQHKRLNEELTCV